MGPADSTAKELAEAQQRLLERDLRLEELGREIEALRVDRATLREELRLATPWSPDVLRTEARRLVRQRLAAVRPSARPVIGLPLASLPVSIGSDVPRWETLVEVSRDWRPALVADPPAHFGWDVDLPAGSRLVGTVALRPAAWELNQGGFDLFVEVSAPDGTLVASLVQAVDPASLADHRRWIPWELAIPVAGAHRISLRTAVAADASPHSAWAVIGDPRLVTPQSAPRTVDRTGSTSGAARRLLDRAAHRAAQAKGGPTISLLLPVHDPDPGLLDRTLAAVSAQTSSDWQLCIVDDGSTDPLVRARLARAAADPRVQLARHETAQGISGATNTAFGLATSAFVATLDHDDLLVPDAIESVQAYLAEHPDTDLLYSDNDLLAGGRRFSAALKPDWSPDLLRSVMYTLHLSVYRRSMVQAAGGWRTEFDGAQDHDLVLRLSERTDRIGHLPRVLYHWRAHAGSAALGELAKPLAYERGRDAIAAHLRRTGHPDATVTRLPEAGRYRVQYPRTAPVTVVAGVPAGLPAAELEQAEAAVRAALRDDDVLVLVPTGEARATGSSGAVDTRAVIEAGVSASAGHVVILMEVVAAPAYAGAIDDLAGHVEAGAAAVGGVVVGAPHGTVVAGAVAFPQGLPMPAHPDASLDDDTRHHSLTMASNRLAVRGVVAIRASDLVAHRAAAAPLTTLGLVGLTLAVSEAGGRVVWNPLARFSATPHAAAALLRWPVADAEALDRGARPDPFWNPQRWPERGDETIPDAVHGTPILDEVDA